MTGREFFDCLDNEHFALAMVAITNTYKDVIPVLKMMAGKPEGMDEEQWIASLKSAYTFRLLKSEIPQDIIESILGDDTIEA